MLNNRQRRELAARLRQAAARTKDPKRRQEILDSVHNLEVMIRRRPQDEEAAGEA